MFLNTGTKTLLFTIIFLLINLFALGQVKDWKDVSKEELAMQVYPKDSSASAVVLFDKAEVDFNRDMDYILDRHVRIKILTEEGYDYATQEVYYNHEYDQNITKVRGHTFVFDEDGDIDRVKLRGKSVFEEDVSDNTRRVRFTLPALEPGAVIEFRYRKKLALPIFLPDWQFQHSIPVVWSEYVAEIPEWYNYYQHLKGNYAFHVKEREPFNETVRFEVKNTDRKGTYYSSQSTRNRYQTRSLPVKGFTNRWVMKDLPAIEDLPYVGNTDDYKAQLLLRLIEVRYPGSPAQPVMKNWPQVAEELLKSQYFGKQLRSYSETEEQVEELTQSLSNNTEKMLAIYDFMIESMVWNDDHSVFTEKDLDEILEAKQGSSAELNLLMVQLLRDAGLNARPVLLSTRTHGKVVEYFAQVSQFNHVISQVTVGDNSYLLDATSENSAINILPAKNLNGKGLALGDKQSTWIDLVPQAENYERVVINASVDSTGKMKGDFHISSTGYSAGYAFSSIEEEGEEGYMNKALLADFSDISVDSFHVEQRDSLKNNFDFKVQFEELSLKDTQQSQEFIYFNPMVFLREQNNPFKQPDRKIPVEYPYLFEKELIASFAVSDSFEIAEVPQPVRISIPGRGIELTRITQVMNGRITVLSKFKLRKKVFVPEEYKLLRDFYSNVVKSHDEQVVLRKKSSSEESDL